DNEGAAAAESGQGSKRAARRRPTEKLVAHDDQIALTWHNVGEPLLIHTQPNAEPGRPYGVCTVLIPAPLVAGSARRACSRPKPSSVGIRTSARTRSGGDPSAPRLTLPRRQRQPARHIRLPAECAPHRRACRRGRAG